MNKKKFFNQLLEKKFIFLFVIITISIFFLTLNILNLKSSKLTVKVVFNSDLFFKTKTLFNYFTPTHQTAWLEESKLLENLLEHFSTNKSHPKFRLFKKSENLSYVFLLKFDLNKHVNSNIFDLLEDSNNFNTTYVVNKMYYTVETYNKNSALKAMLGYLHLPGNLETELNKINILHSQAKRDVDNLISDVKKEKFFKFIELKTPEEVLKFDNKLIAFIISIFGAFLINIAILILIKYKKYI